MSKLPSSFRLSETATALHDALAEKLGLSKTAVLEQALRLLAQREGVKVASAKPK